MVQQDLFGKPPKRRPATLEESFRLWLEANPSTVNLFLRFAREARGRGRFGIKALAERVRWEHLVVRKEGAKYAINNSFLSRLARELVRRDPSLEGLFEFRKIGRTK